MPAKDVVFKQGLRPIEADRVPHWADRELAGPWDDPGIAPREETANVSPGYVRSVTGVTAGSSDTWATVRGGQRRYLLGLHETERKSFSDRRVTEIARKDMTAMEVNYWTTPPRWWLNNPYIQHPNITQLPVIAIGGTKNTLSPRWDWPVDWAVPHLVSIVTTLNAASAMTNKQAAEQIIATGETGISQFLDDYCGTPPRLIPWPFPGPPPWVSIIASELAEKANTLQEGSLRTALLQLAGRLLDRVALNPQSPPS